MDMIICVSIPNGHQVMQRRQPVQDQAASETAAMVGSSMGRTSPSQGAIFPWSRKYRLKIFRMISARPTAEYLIWGWDA